MILKTIKLMNKIFALKSRAFDSQPRVSRSYLSRYFSQALCGFAMLVTACSTTFAQTPPAVPTPTNSAQRDAATISGRVALTESATASDAAGAVVLSGNLPATSLAGTLDAPLNGVRFVVENRSAVFMRYVAGFISFYDSQAVRCGDGLFTVTAFAAGERVETDAPALRLTCAPATWRIVITQLVPEISSSGVVTPVILNSITATPRVRQTDDKLIVQPTDSLPNDAAPVVVFINRDGRFFVGGLATEKDEISTRIRAALVSKSANERDVSINADPEVMYATLVEVVDAAKAGGATRIGLLTGSRPVQ